MPKGIRQLLIIGAPLFVGTVNTFHPLHFGTTGTYDALAPHVGWWITLHVLNLFGFALAGLAGYLLVSGKQGTAAAVSRVSLAIYVPAYVGFDGIIGIGTGVLMAYGQTLTGGQLEVLKTAIDAYWNNRVAFGLAAVGSVLWGSGMTAAAIAFADQNRRPWLVGVGVVASAVSGWGASSGSFGTPLWWGLVGLVAVITLLAGRFSLPVTLLVLSGVFFSTAHVVPYGPLAMACFLTAAILLQERQSDAPAAVPAPSSV